MSVAIFQEKATEDYISSFHADFCPCSSWVSPIIKPCSLSLCFFLLYALIRYLEHRAKRSQWIVCTQEKLLNLINRANCSGFSLFFSLASYNVMTLSNILMVFDRPVIDQNFYYAGLKFTSPTFSCAISNMLPAMTFVMAVIFRYVISTKIIINYQIMFHIYELIWLSKLIYIYMYVYPGWRS